MRSRTSWQLGNDQAVLSGEWFSCVVELAHPDHGLQRLRAGDISLSQLKILQITADPPAPPQGEVVIDRYVRGRDLIVSYAQTPQRTARPQLYWRALADDDQRAAGLELWLSVQTSLLASNPTLRLCSTMPSVQEALSTDGRIPDWRPVAGGQLVKLDASQNCFVFRLVGCDVSYCEMIYPADCEGVEVAEGEGGLELRYRLFQRDLEKGVIRRGRVRSCLVPRIGDLEAATTCFEEMCGAPLPLTA